LLTRAPVVHLRKEILSKLKKLIKDPRLFLLDAYYNRVNQNISKSNKVVFVIGFSTWKTYLRKYFSEYKLDFIPKNISTEDFNKQYRKKILKHKSNCQVFVWGFKFPQYIQEFLLDNEIKIVYVEDGFIRSIQLGATKAPPMSLTLDSKTTYFDATKESELENLLNNYNFSENLKIIEDSKKLIKKILDNDISKYNNDPSVDIMQIYGKKDSKRILVIGQVEDDASIKYGCKKKMTNNDLVRLAYKENPEAQIIYKPHPDVLHGYRERGSNPNEVSDIAMILTQNISLSSAFNTIDHVYTITSLSGFEALLRGIKTTTICCPFYSGWGLTDDRQINKRRKRKLNIVELFAISYIIYPQYFDTETGNNITLENVIDKIIDDKKDLNFKSISISGLKQICLKLPQEIIEKFEKEANYLNISVEDLIKIYLADKITQIEKHKILVQQNLGEK